MRSNYAAMRPLADFRHKQAQLNKSQQWVDTKCLISGPELGSFRSNISGGLPSYSDKLDWLRISYGRSKTPLFGD